MRIFVVIITTLFLIVSIVYDQYSRDTELHYLQHLAKGTLKIIANQNNTINSSTNFLQVNFTNGLNVTYDTNRSIFDGNNERAFLILMKGSGKIQANEDSFYRIKDSRNQQCSEQVINDIKFLSQNKLRIAGKFDDCPNSEYQIVISQQKDKDVSKININVKADKAYNRIILRYAHNDQSHYFGLGQQFSHFNLGKNRPYSLFVRQKGVGRTDQPQSSILNWLHGIAGSYYNSYSPAPIWLSSHKLAYILHSYCYSAWINNQILVWNNEIEMTLLIGDNFKQVISGIAQINGYTDPIPSWVNQGAIVGLQGGTQSVQNKYNQLKKANPVIRGVWLQDWVSKRQSLGYSRLWWNWELDKQHFPLWDALRIDLAEDNVNLLIYINPMLTDVSDKSNVRRNYYQQAKKLNCFVKNNQDTIFETGAFSDFKASMINFQIEKCRQFYKQILRSAIKETGAKGMMVDFGQSYPVQNIHSSIEQAVKKHNQYPVIYHKTARQVLDQFKDIYTFTRSGFLETPKYVQSLWAGDQNMNFKKHSGLPSCLNAMLSSGLIGYSNTHCDVGGYTFFDNLGISVRSPLLMTRWMQLGAFSPVFRTHEGNLPEKSLQVYSNIKIAEQFAFYSHIYAILAPYRAQQSQKALQQKLPLIRSMFVQNSNNPQIFSINDQYYLGQQIIVAPILGKKMARKYYLPSGNWTNIWSGEVQQGCECSKDSTSFMPPVFINSEAKFTKQVVQKVKQAEQVYHLVIEGYKEYKDKFFDL